MPPIPPPECLAALKFPFSVTGLRTRNDATHAKTTANQREPFVGHQNLPSDPMVLKCVIPTYSTCWLSSSQIGLFRATKLVWAVTRDHKHTHTHHRHGAKRIRLRAMPLHKQESLDEYVLNVTIHFEMKNIRSISTLTSDWVDDGTSIDSFVSLRYSNNLQGSRRQNFLSFCPETTKHQEICTRWHS